MHDFKKNGASVRLLTAALLVAWNACVQAQTPPAASGAEALDAAASAGEAPSVAATAAAEPGAAAAADRKVDINEYVVRGNTVLQSVEIEKAVYDFLGPQRTMKDIEGARDALLALYHERGYQSVYVDLPQQQVTGGVVYLQVTETTVGRVRVVGAKHYSPVEIRDQVPALQEGKVPDFTQAQAELSELNRTPNRQVMPLVKEGTMPGTMDVDLKVDDKNPFTFSTSLNNDYSADTKPLRLSTTIGYDNLWQLGHSISVTYYTAPQDTSNAKVWSGSYTMPLDKQWSLQFSGYQSDSNVATIGGTNVLGKGHSFGVATTYSLAPLGNWTNAFSFGVDFKDFDEAVTLGDDGNTVPIKYEPFTLSYNGYRYTDDSQTALNLSVLTAARLGYGSNSSEFDDKRFRASPTFTILKGDGTYTQKVGGDWQAALRAAFQLSSGPLVSNEQFSAGGATSIRGYLAAERTGDQGYLVSLEWRTPSVAKYLGPKVNDWRFYTFAEAAWLRLQDPLPEQEATFHLASVGVGTRLQMLDWLSGSLDFGYPLVDGANTKAHDPRVNFSVRASF
jgi:hemolysin activation/secretion protein